MDKIIKVVGAKVDDTKKIVDLTDASFSHESDTIVEINNAALLQTISQFSGAPIEEVINFHSSYLGSVKRQYVKDQFLIKGYEVVDNH